MFLIVELLLGSGNISNILELNAKNSRGFTAMDLLDIVIENSNEIHPEPVPVVYKDWINYFKFKIGRDQPSDARDALLLVAALIATVTYQAAMDPPSGIFLEKNPNNFHWEICIFILEYIGLFYINGHDRLSDRWIPSRELQVCIFSMGVTYGMVITSITPKDAIQYITLFTALLLPYLLQKLPRGIRKRWQRPPS
ncbi:hypothetical protein Patl1_00083 [Pistacia atlantica]|uniref:Uncharacterized protein n=1 Tax=Pistacia atlantica TaxID=434234 RepID=A0ACC1CC19_9ROSI|nr:hypothetical protein Patl1_00083 [Pistacia atlantica]